MFRGTSPGYAGEVQVMEYFRRRMTMSEYDYPPGVPIFGHVAIVAVAGVAVAQRDAFVPPGWALPVALVAAGTSLAGDLVRPGSMIPRPLLAVVVTAATALLLVQQVIGQFDVAPFILVFMVGEVAATAKLAVSLATAAGAVAVLSGFAVADRLGDVPWYIAGVAVGWIIGHLLQTQLRLLHQERASHVIQTEQAATRERQRIAREIHDVVAHSLSITMLHLTGARRALEEDRDVDDAVEALADAERLGRQAMADIRRTVGLLEVKPAGTRPEPAIGDIPNLVEDFRRAGLQVSFEMRGDPGAVSSATGLGLYRISQESLANVIKHAPGADAEVTLSIAPESITLVVRNPTAAPAVLPMDSSGSGVRGMRERAELLGGTLQAGPDHQGWSVRAEIPLPTDSCPLSLRRRTPEQS
jgi:signal transduction histidine kinase